MPDREFKTVSASQVPELLNISNWGTRLTLHHQFARRVTDERKQTIRMRLGKLFEAVILELVAEKMVLEVLPNLDAEGKPVYVRHPTLPLGCTVDATILCPTRGRGSVEAKAVDKFEWEKNWTESSAPKSYEAQLQTQMLVEENTWGIIACLIYNEGSDGRLVIYERRPNVKAMERITLEATNFMADVAAGKEPPAFGLPCELELVNDLYPETDKAAILEDEGNYDIAEMARMYDWTVKQKAGFERAAKEMLPKLINYMKSYGYARLGGGVRVRLNKPQMSGQYVMLPADLRKRLRTVADNLESAGSSAAPIIEAIEWCHIARMPGVQNRLTVIEDETAVHQEADMTNNLEGA